MLNPSDAYAPSERLDHCDVIVTTKLPSGESEQKEAEGQQKARGVASSWRQVLSEGPCREVCSRSDWKS